MKIYLIPIIMELMFTFKVWELIPSICFDTKQGIILRFLFFKINIYFVKIINKDK